MRPDTLRHTRLPRLVASTALGLLMAAGPLSGQDGDLRIGITFGGIGLVGVAAEFFDGSRSIEVTLSTFSFKDVSASVAGKQYFGGASVRPFAGVGLWVLAAPAPDAEERAGMALVFQAPIGFDWRVGGDHYAGLALNVNRALLVRRPDPDSDRELQGHLVPLPAFYYRYRR